MKANVKKIACLALTAAMISSVAACGKKKSDSKAIKAAETFLEATVKLDAKKIKKLDDSFGLNDEDIDALLELADEDIAAAVYDKASYEIDEDSLKEKKSSASVKATITMPDVEAAFEESDGDEDDFIEAIEDQKAKEYTSFDVKLEFDVDDGEYTLSNAADVLEDLFTPILSLGGDIDVDPDPTDEPTDTEMPTETEEPTELTTEESTTAATTEDTTPIDTTAAPVSTSDLGFLDLKKATLTADTYKSAFNKADSSAFVLDSDPADASMSAYDLTEYVVAMGGSGIISGYFTFSSVQEANKYFTDTCDALSSMADAYHNDPDFAYMVYSMSTVGYVYYMSDTGVCFMMFSMEGNADNEILTNFFTELGAM